jgi:hypothetical protein
MANVNLGTTSAQPFKLVRVHQISDRNNGGINLMGHLGILLALRIFLVGASGRSSPACALFAASAVASAAAFAAPSAGVPAASSSVTFAAAVAVAAACGCMYSAFVPL